jgi:signal transduction histidine kinase
LTSGNRIEDYREAIVDMLEDAEQLSRVLDAMILLAQADAGTVPIDRRVLDLDALVADVASQCEVLAQEKAQRLLVSCTGGQATVDPTLLRIAVANLVHNAIRYGPRSSDVAVRAFSTSADWVIEVEDGGPGIPQEHHAHLFERFYRVDPGRSRSLGGVGLGLSMARWSVEAHNGRIEVHSREGVGSRFRIVLPKHAGKPTADPEPSGS